jgi:hypothetical protein
MDVGLLFRASWGTNWVSIGVSSFNTYRDIEDNANLHLSRKRVFSHYKNGCTGRTERIKFFKKMYFWSMKICRNKCTKYNFFENGRATCLDDFTWNDPYMISVQKGMGALRRHRRGGSGSCRKMHEEGSSNRCRLRGSGTSSPVGVCFLRASASWVTGNWRFQTHVVPIRFPRGWGQEHAVFLTAFWTWYWGGMRLGQSLAAGISM